MTPKQITFDGTWHTLKHIFPIKNAAKPIDFDRASGVVVFYTKDGECKAESGDVLCRDNEGNVSVVKQVKA